MTVPGAVRGWEALHSLGARLGWAAQFTAAVDYAADGVPLARSVAAALAENQEVLLRDDGCRELFFPGNLPLAEGQTLKQPSGSFRKWT